MSVWFGVTWEYLLISRQNCQLFEVWGCLVNQVMTTEIVTEIAFRIKSHIQEFLWQKAYYLI